jgi:Glycosyl hydrolases family 16
MKKKLLALAAALIAVSTMGSLAVTGATSAHAASGPSFSLKWSTDFGSPVPVGSFSDCSSSTFQCQGLKSVSAPVYRNLGAYPTGWPDTCANPDDSGICPNGAEGGYYEPQADVSISDHMMIIKESTNGSGVSSMAAMVPLQALNQTYGEFTETFRVTKETTGYKSAHLIVANANDPVYNETDYPEGDWNSTFWAYQHNSGGGNADSYQGTTFTAWNTTTIEWYPGHMIFLLNGKVIGSSTANVQKVPGIWVWQNENSTDGESAPANSTAEMEIKYAAVYTYNG